MAQRKSTKKLSARKQSTPSDEELERYHKAIETFENGLKSLHKGDLERAREHLTALLAEFPDERELRDRAQTYLRVCDRQTKGSNAFSPRSFEELVTSGVFWHNEGDYSRAIKYLSKAVEMQPESEHAHFCLAAAYARSGDTENASRHLKQSIAVDPYNRVRAATDEDFEAIRRDAGLADVLAQTVPPRHPEPL